MLIVCPSCASRYELDGAKLGAEGRKVRCASCQTLWHVAPEPEMPAVPSPEETQALLNEELEQAAAIEAQVSAQVSAVADGMAEDGRTAEGGDESAAPTPRKVVGRPPRKGHGKKGKGKPGPSRTVAIAAALSLIGVALLGVLVMQRDRAARVAPQLAGVFEKLGLPVNTRGLTLGAVESGLVEDAAGRFLIVEGDVTNIAKSNTRVPAIEVAVQDSAGQTLYSWKTDPPRPELEPAELMRFRARLAAPPATGQTVLVRFTSSGPTAAGRH